MVDQLGSSYSQRKRGALRMLGDIVALNPRLSPRARQAAHDAIVKGAQDRSSFLVRDAAVQALARGGTAEDIALLEQIAERDSATVTANGKVTYPVRDAARQAIAKLRK